ncbi:diacylglycerol/lipid kinase family protein [Deinococcus sp.]|uniref:diacylglycerol/lipid kinase family protein n=1 Tax=Deinococcus sp. TaxID=47478 RepID=UPI003CC5E0BB
MSRLFYAVVLNPQAGRGLAGREWPRLKAALEGRRLAYTLLTTASAQEACAALARLPPDRPVLAVGGDGTVHGLLPEVQRSGRALGVVPLGSGNDFAGMLGLRPGDFGGALARLTRPAVQLDLSEAQLEGAASPLWTPLLNGLGMGLDAQVAALLQVAPAAALGLKLGGFQRYVWAALQAVKRMHLHTLQIDLDAQPWYSGPSCLVAVMNGTRYGSGFRVAPHADPQDGLLDVVVGGKLSRAELWPLMARLLRGTHLSHPQVFSARAQQVRLRWTVLTHAHLDGEPLGEQSGLSVRVSPGALRFLSGRPAEP